jgi:hypothetical protein
MALHLYVGNGLRQGNAIPLTEDRPLVIGRNPSADVLLPEGYVSRWHAEILVADGRVLLRDLGSRNGTWLGERRLAEGEPACGLALGDRVSIAGTWLCLQEGGPMTAGQWPISRDPEAMLEHVLPVASPRKLGLFSSACFRRLHPLPSRWDYSSYTLQGGSFECWSLITAD